MKLRALRSHQPCLQRRWRGKRLKRGIHQGPAIHQGQAALICSIFALALADTLILTPKFRSEATIEFNKENTDSPYLDDRPAMLGDANSMDYSGTQQTQVKTLLTRLVSELVSL